MAGKELRGCTGEGRGWDQWLGRLETLNVLLSSPDPLMFPDEGMGLLEG
jgi:hypothetical protein